MHTSSPTRRSSDEIIRLGDEILHSKVEPLLGPKGVGKFVAIDIETGEYEVDDNSQRAMKRLLTRYPHAEMLLVRAGYEAAFRMGLR
jgi:hypothetical protein